MGHFVTEATRMKWHVISVVTYFSTLTPFMITHSCKELHSFTLTPTSHTHFQNSDSAACWCSTLTFGWKNNDTILDGHGSFWVMSMHTSLHRLLVSQARGYSYRSGRARSVGPIPSCTSVQYSLPDMCMCPLNTDTHLSLLDPDSVPHHHF